MKPKKIITIVTCSLAVLVLFIIAINITINSGYGGLTPVPYGTAQSDKASFGVATEGSAQLDSSVVTNEAAAYGGSGSDKYVISNNLNIETKNINKTLSKIEDLVSTSDGKIATKNVNLG